MSSGLMMVKGPKLENMMRIETGVSEGYVKTWGVAQAVAEFVQNALDARDQGGHAHIRRNRKGRLIVRDTGAGLSLRHLAIGVSEKGEGARGQFGEGMKLAMLVMCREDRHIVIHSGGMRITPALETGALGVRTLVFYVGKVAERKGTTVYLECTENEAADAIGRFDSLDTGRRVRNRLSKPGGNLYVNGVLCAELEDALYSYHLGGKQAQELANRDRSSVDFNAARRMCAAVLTDGAQPSALLAEVLRGVVEKPSGFEADLFLPWHLDAQIAKQFKRAFRKAFGKYAVATRGDSNDARLNYLGYRPVRLPHNWFSGLGEYLPTEEKVIAQANRRRSPTALNDGQRQSLADVLHFLGRRVRWCNVNVRVTDELVLETGVACEGQRVGKTIWIVARLLDGPKSELVATLLHEYAHFRSECSDCSAGFEAELTRLSGLVSGIDG